MTCGASKNRGTPNMVIGMLSKISKVSTEKAVVQLGEKLGVKKLEDWYNIRYSDCVTQKEFNTILHQYGTLSKGKLIDHLKVSVMLMLRSLKSQPYSLFILSLRGMNGSLRMFQLNFGIILIIKRDTLIG